MRLLYLYGEEITGRRAREIHALNRVCSLAQAGVHITLVYAEGEWKGEDFVRNRGLVVSPNLHFQSFPREWKVAGLGIKSSSYFYKQVATWMEKEPPFDGVYGIHLKSAAFIKKRFPKTPFIFEAHEVFADAYHPRSSKYQSLSLQEEAVYRQVDAVVSTSAYLQSELLKRYRLPEARFISPNCSEEFFFQCALNEVEPKSVFYMGSFQKWKGVDIALAAMKELPEYRLTVVGGTDSEVRSFEKNASSNVRFLGYRSHQEVREVIENAEIALIPNRLVPVNSLHTFPMKLVESAAAGKKIVSTDLPILNELKPGSWCSRVLPERPDLFARAIREQSLINQDVELIRSWAKEFRWNFQAERLKAFLNERSF